ncbi:glycosyltransferase family 2 protein [Polynucleobacter sp. AP-Titi-500A-B4]|uniref:glycosyltransferase family 2 protein n=1 Tax=Polynucleobacter sp. AP-Titi-500A-B4 TaxID=2576923 RepID=UPI001BFE6F1D|nr:glycosyltransferase family 2 protein [Polynucleobacter sp. AP-Titi-500A-B4]QWE11893.1 glycosyltransferase family 2 protein [Polynucleobacter sp. AP-Titi-500A-B4]
MKISVIVATYNRVDALNLVLQSLETQGDKNFEVIIADDGSRNETREFINRYAGTSRLDIKHIWHEDKGFRLALIRNLASHSATGDYLIFLDGDCIVQPDFIEHHRALAQKGFLVTGSRVLLNEALTKELLSTPRWDFKKFTSKLLMYRLNGGINKYWPLKIKFGNGVWRDYKKFVWRRIKGCNLACWKADADAINGFDETLTGWGHEDADFVFRLQRHHIKRKSGSWSTEVLHLYHKMNDQSNAAENARRVREKILAKAM